ncbi:MAG TPA: hypothetical protein VFL81_00665 [Candidatus Saccharimonadales bacterium]|nr:hypothetical protein [Candidatus Saccharimonadales bacterium]
MQFLDRLPQEVDKNAEYMLLAPDGGYGVHLEMFMRREVNFLDVLAKRDDWRFLIRLYPVRNQVIEDSRRPGVYMLLGTMGEFLDYDGRETGRIVSVYVYISTLETHDGMPAGGLRMWDQTTLDNLNAS